MVRGEHGMFGLLPKTAQPGSVCTFQWHRNAVTPHVCGTMSDVTVSLCPRVLQIPVSCSAAFMSVQPWTHGPGACARISCCRHRSSAMADVQFLLLWGATDTQEFTTEQVPKQQGKQSLSRQPHEEKKKRILHEKFSSFDALSLSRLARSGVALA